MYIGRGWDRVGAHTLGYNDKSIAISFMGNYVLVPPTDRMLTAAQELIQCGINQVSVCLSVLVCNLVWPCVCMSVCPAVFLCSCVSWYWSVWYLFVCLSVCLFVCLLSMYLSVCYCLWLYFVCSCVCLSACLSVCLSLCI